jgi:FkbM family methyltransferase
VKRIVRNAREIVKKLLPSKLVEYLANIKNHNLDDSYSDVYSIKSYSQEGEDMILRRIFENQKTGFYVDAGAHHPFRFSNTYYFYKQGWQGINIDAMPGSMNIFRRFRKRDINIESGVALNDAQYTFFVFKEEALNTFDDVLAQQYKSAGYEILSQLQVRARPLADLLKEYLPFGQRIDLLSVDVEGFDLDVLKSNDWQLFRPRVLITEELRSVSGGGKDSVRKFLTNVGYHEFARTYNSVIYMSNEEPI